MYALHVSFNIPYGHIILSYFICLLMIIIEIFYILKMFVNMLHYLLELQYTISYNKYLTGNLMFFELFNKHSNENIKINNGLFFYLYRYLSNNNNTHK